LVSKNRKVRSIFLLINYTLKKALENVHLALHDVNHNLNFALMGKVEEVEESKRLNHHPNNHLNHFQSLTHLWEVRSRFGDARRRKKWKVK
jgi:hypothetical protein